MSYGYLVRKRKPQEETIREKAINEARWTYWRGISNAWSKYTHDNPRIKQAEKERDKAIGRTFKLYLSEDPNYNPKLFFKAVLKAYEDHADKVASVWKDFIKEMNKLK